MPRPPMMYSVPQPLEPLNIEEVRFWLQIMLEHALFIKLGLPCDRTDLIEEAETFYSEFEALLDRANNTNNDKKFAELVADAEETVRDFYRYKRRLLNMKLRCELGGYNFPLLLDHIAREAEYFLRLLRKIKENKQPLKEGSKPRETNFWLQLMADHAKFISHLLDPSERALVNTANEFSDEFDGLVLQSRDFMSMLHGDTYIAPAFNRFLMDTRVATTRLRDFKKAAEEMIAECRLLGLIPELLADHVRREADHFLLVLALMEKNIMKENGENCFDERDLIDQSLDFGSKTASPEVMQAGPVTMADDEDRPEVVVQLNESITIPDNLKTGNKNFQTFSAPAKDNIINVEELEVEADAAMVQPEVTPGKKDYAIDKSVKQPKYKWTNKWPRQLGRTKD